MRNIIVTGTDTEIGKSVFAAMLTLGLNASYFKPVQSGTQSETDRQAVLRMTGLGEDRVLADGATLSQPLSPHRSAELDGVEIDLNALTPPPCERPLIIEGAGGLMVPINRQTLFIDMFQRWNLPIVLCARTGLGTINHTLLSLQALRKRNLEIIGVAFVGDDNPDNMRTLSDMGEVKNLGRLPMLETLNAKTLTQVFADHFNAADFGAPA